MSSVDYKIKYLDLRAKFMKTAERMYRLGKEDGLKEGQLQAQQQQMQQQAEQAAMAAQGGMPGQEPQVDPQTGEPLPPQEGGMPGQEMAPEDMSPEEMAQMQEEQMGEEQASELDQRINELEELVAKGEKPKVTDLRKAVMDLSDLRKNQKSMKPNHKKVISTKQKSLVDNILKKWEKEANKESTDKNLDKIIGSEDLEIK